MNCDLVILSDFCAKTPEGGHETYKLETAGMELMRESAHVLRHFLRLPQQLQCPFTFLDLGLG
jgi:hypothetical protein